MTKPFLTVAIVAALVATTGCSLFRKSNRPKESSAISSEVEATFRQRWLDKRIAELTAQGVAAPAARTQAEQEFRDRFGFDQKPKK
jgi:1,2-phenylacetyl-CoA epoxidase catalytic subunit